MTRTPLDATRAPGRGSLTPGDAAAACRATVRGHAPDPPTRTMSVRQPEDHTDLSRRSFLGIALGTLPAAALPGGALAALWPADERDRDVDAPYLLLKDGRAIWDPAGEVHCVEPTLRELLAVSWDCRIDSAVGDELDEVLAEYVIDHEDLDPEEDGPRIEASVARHRERIDEPADLGVWSHAYDAWLDVEGNRAAHSTWELFPEDKLDDAGLYFVEGSCPGSSFTSVCFDGTVDELNEALVRVGLNAVVEERAKGS